MCIFPVLPSRPSDSRSGERLIRVHYATLVDRMDPDNGLLPALFSDNIITMREMASIKAEKTYFDRNECLLRCLLRKSDSHIRKFIDILAIDQRHVAGILDARYADE